MRKARTKKLYCLIGDDGTHRNVTADGTGVLCERERGHKGPHRCFGRTLKEKIAEWPNTQILSRKDALAILRLDHYEGHTDETGTEWVKMGAPEKDSECQLWERRMRPQGNGIEFDEGEIVAMAGYRAFDQSGKLVR